MKLYIDRNNEKEYSKYINNEHELAIDERKVHMEENMIITISRQYGSGGSQVAKILAERMGVWCYDRDILTIAAERIGNEELTEDTINDLNYKRNDVASAGITGDMGMGNIPIYNQMFLEQAKIIRKLANYGSAVFLGRCADYILKDRDDVLNVFIHGDMPEKIKRITRLYKVNEQEAVKMMADTDKRRGTNYSFYTDQKWGKASNYTLCLNSSQLGYDRCEKIIIECSK